MSKAERRVLVEGYQPKAPKSGTRIVRDKVTGKVVAKGPKKLPKASSAIITQHPNKKDN